MLLDGGDFLLERPRVLQEQRLLFSVILVTDDVAGIARRDFQKLVFHVGHEFAVLDAAGSNFQCILVANFVVLALLRNAPSVEAGDFLSGVQGNRYNTVLAPAGTKNFVRGADVLLDLVGRDDRNRVFGVEQNSIGLVVMLR